MDVVRIPGATTTPYTPGAIALTRAQQLLGTTMTAVNGTDFGGDGPLPVKTFIQGAATTALLRTDATGGVLRIATTAANANGAWVSPASAGSLVANPRTEKWYLRARFQIEDVPTVVAHEEAGVVFGKNAAAPNIKLGAPNRQTSDITNFSWAVIDHTAATTASGSTTIPLDTAWHTLEMWNDTTNLNFGIDLGSGTTPTATTASTNIDTTDGMTWNIITFQDASGSGANRRSSTDSIYVVTASQ